MAALCVLYSVPMKREKYSRVYYIFFLTLSWVTLPHNALRTPRNISDLLAHVPVLPPSDLLLYPLDFQNTWQASENAQINIHQEIPQYGPQDAWNYYKRFSDDYARIHQRQINKQMLLADYKNEQDQQRANLYHYLDRLYLRNHLDS